MNCSQCSGWAFNGISVLSFTRCDWKCIGNTLCIKPWILNERLAAMIHPKQTLKNWHTGNPEKLLKGSVTSKMMESITIFSLGPYRTDKQKPPLKATLNFNRVQFAPASGNIWTAVFWCVWSLFPLPCQCHLLIAFSLGYMILLNSIIGVWNRERLSGGSGQNKTAEAGILAESWLQFVDSIPSDFT